MMPIVFYLQGKEKLHQTGGFAASSPSAGGGSWGDLINNIRHFQKKYDKGEITSWLGLGGP